MHPSFVGRDAAPGPVTQCFTLPTLPLRGPGSIARLRDRAPRAASAEPSDSPLRVLLDRPFSNSQWVGQSIWPVGTGCFVASCQAAERRIGQTVVDGIGLTIPTLGFVPNLLWSNAVGTLPSGIPRAVMLIGDLEALRCGKILGGLTRAELSQAC